MSEGEDRAEIDVAIDARRFQGVWANAVRLDAKPDARQRRERQEDAAAGAD